LPHLLPSPRLGGQKTRLSLPLLHPHSLPNPSSVSYNITHTECGTAKVHTLQECGVVGVERPNLSPGAMTILFCSHVNIRQREIQLFKKNWLVCQKQHAIVVKQVLQESET
jgi:hypothetical protein